jgi:hypothetical protein
MDTLSTKLAISRSAMQSATCPPLTLPWAPLSLGPSGNRVSRFRSAWILCPRDPRFPDPRWPDGRPPVGTFPDGSDHCHASQERTVLIASRCFGVFNAKVHMSTGFPIPRIPTLRFADSWPLTMALSSLSDVRSAAPTHRGFRLRDFEMQRFRVHESPIYRSPTFFGSLTRVLNGWTVQVKPQTSPNANPKALICVSPDGSNVDDSPMVATCPNQMDGSDCIGVFTMDFPTSCSQNSRLSTLSRSPPRVSP